MGSSPGRHILGGEKNRNKVAVQEGDDFRIRERTRSQAKCPPSTASRAHLAVMGEEENRTFFDSCQQLGGGEALRPTDFIDTPFVRLRLNLTNTFGNEIGQLAIGNWLRAFCNGCAGEKDTYCQTSQEPEHQIASSGTKIADSKCGTIDTPLHLTHKWRADIITWMTSGDRASAYVRAEPEKARI
jgi:hypothetical protein